MIKGSKNKFSLEDKDAASMKDRIFNPAVMTMAPLTPAFIVSGEPFTFFFIIFGPLTFFNGSAKLCRNYIHNYEKWYLIIFFSLLLLRVILELFDELFKGILFVVVPVIYVFWARFSFTNWEELYRSAQVEVKEKKK